MSTFMYIDRHELDEAGDAIGFYFGSCDVLWPHTASLVGLFAWE